MKNWRKSRGLFLTTVATGAMLNPLNSSMIALALYSIQKDFGLSYLTVSWLISSFYLASAVAQPVAGKLGDLIGRKKMFLGGLILVAISAVGAPFAPAFAILIIMRLFQAVGSGSVYPAGMGMVRNHIRERQRSGAWFHCCVYVGDGSAWTNDWRDSNRLGRLEGNLFSQFACVAFLLFPSVVCLAEGRKQREIEFA